MNSRDAMNLDTQDAVDPIIGDAEPRQDQVMARSKPINNKNENDYEEFTKGDKRKTFSHSLCRGISHQLPME